MFSVAFATLTFHTVRSWRCYCCCRCWLCCCTCTGNCQVTPLAALCACNQRLNRLASFGEFLTPIALSPFQFAIAAINQIRSMQLNLHQSELMLQERCNLVARRLVAPCCMPVVPCPISGILFLAHGQLSAVCGTTKCCFCCCCFRCGNE